MNLSTGASMRLAPDQRHYILQEMGIQSYVPRIVLPGARPSPIRQDSAPSRPLLAAAEPCRQPGAESADMTPASLMPTPPVPARVPSTQPPIVVSAPTPAVSGRPDVATAVPTAPRVAAVTSSPAAAAEAVHFAFAYVPVNEHLAVICELLWARSALLSTSCRQLLADMLKAIGAPCDADRLAPMVFSWPLADAGDMPQDAQTARHMLEGFVSRRLKLRAAPYLLILAEQSAHLLFPPASQPHTGKLHVHPHFPVQVLVTHSLHAMEAVRELKRSAWQALQPLKQALAEAASPDQLPRM